MIIIIKEEHLLLYIIYNYANFGNDEEKNIYLLFLTE